MKIYILSILFLVSKIYAAAAENKHKDDGFTTAERYPLRPEGQRISPVQESDFHEINEPEQNGNKHVNGRNDVDDPEQNGRNIVSKEPKDNVEIIEEPSDKDPADKAKIILPIPVILHLTSFKKHDHCIDMFKHCNACY